MVKQKISRHRGFQLMITTGICLSALVPYLVHFIDLSLLSIVTSMTANMFWLWEDEISALVFGID